jgi:hypothetical protein
MMAFAILSGRAFAGVRLLVRNATQMSGRNLCPSDHTTTPGQYPQSQVLHYT